ncbi:ABC transporter substrate-binding protein [Aliidiomarina sp. Khilg15.8]
MTNVYVVRLAMLLLAAALSISQAIARPGAEHITWVLNTAPPFHIVGGNYQGEGFCDALMDAVDEAMPQYNSSQLVMPQTRIGLQFERNQNQCFPCMIHRTNSDGATHVFTEPTHLYRPHGIITTAQNATRMKILFGDPVRLSSLLQRNDFTLGHPAGRAFGALQPILDAHEGDDSYRLLRTGEYATTAILQMIKSGRIDYTIDYASLHEYNNRTSNGDLVFVEIAETQNQYVYGAIGCTNNSWGQQVVRDINAAMADIHQNASFIQSLRLWFPNYNDDDYLKLLEEKVWQKR